MLELFTGVAVGIVIGAVAMYRFRRKAEPFVLPENYIPGSPDRYDY